MIGKYFLTIPGIRFRAVRWTLNEITRSHESHSIIEYPRHLAKKVERRIRYRPCQINRGLRKYYI